MPFPPNGPPPGAAPGAPPGAQPGMPPGQGMPPQAGPPPGALPGRGGVPGRPGLGPQQVNPQQRQQIAARIDQKEAQLKRQLAKLQATRTLLDIPSRQPSGRRPRR
jgi:hypothetical protein